MIILGIAIGIFMLDMYFKYKAKKNWAYGSEKKIANGKLILTRYHNYGAALNFGEKCPQLIKIVSTVLFGIMGIFMGIFIGKKKKDRILSIGFGLILGGSLSNLYDRWKYGYVTDYFSFAVKWKRLRKMVFNLGDIGILLGSFMVGLRKSL